MTMRTMTVATLLLATGAPAAVINVPGDYTRIQEAIDASSSGDTISIAAGTYNELINFSGKAITVHGAGATLTTIDGTGLAGSVVTFNSGEGQDSTLRNVALTGGSGTMAPDPVFGNVLCGGGLHLFGSSPTIEDCLLTHNACWGGGGMFNLLSSPTVDRCTFRSNQAEGHGGGSYNLDHSDPKFTDCVFELNDASWGGGMTSTVDCYPTVTDCDFIANTIFNVGGGMFNRSRSSPTITGCLFYGQVQSGNPLGNGGGICSYGVGNGGGPCYPIISDCHFEQNTASGDAGGIAHAYEVYATVTNCSFVHNSAGRNGGGMACMGNKDPYAPANPIVTDCLFVDNHADEYGGGFHSRHSSPTVDGCVMQENSAGLGGGGAGFENSPMAAIGTTLFCGNLPGNTDGHFDDQGTNTYDDECLPCPGDITGDGTVGVDDLLAVIADWNDPYTVDDLLEVIANWNATCP